MKAAGTALSAYLNNDLSGAAAALTLLDGLQTSHDDDLKDFAMSLRQAIAQDRDHLVRLMTNAGVQVTDRGDTTDIVGSRPQWKHIGDIAADGELKTFQMLEWLALELDAKRALWPVLRIVSTDIPSLRTDFTLMAQRAEERRTAVETRRLEWAAKAFRNIPTRSRPQLLYSSSRVEDSHQRPLLLDGQTPQRLAAAWSCARAAKRAQPRTGRASGPAL